MKLNVAAKQEKIYTHEGGRAMPAPNAAADLRRAVMACALTSLWFVLPLTRGEGKLAAHQLAGRSRDVVGVDPGPGEQFLACS